MQASGVDELLIGSNLLHVQSHFHHPQVSEPIPGKPKTLQKYSVKALEGGVDFYYHAEWIKNIIERCGEDFFETSTDPAAIFLYAHLKTLETRGNFELRLEERLKLWRRMAELGIDDETWTKLSRLVSRVMKMPEEFELKFDEEWSTSGAMELTVDLPETNAERITREILGRKGAAFVLLPLFKRKLGLSPEESQQLIEGLSLENLGALAEAILEIESVEALKKWIGEHQPR